MKLLLLMFLPFCGAVVLREALVELRNDTAYDLEKVASKRRLLEPREARAPNVVEYAPVTNNDLKERDTVWTKFSGHSYAFFPDRKSWANAQMHCLGLGGYLVVINNQEEENFVDKLSRGQTWVGLSDAQETGFWLWINSDPLCVTFWCPDEPNNAGGQEHCTVMTSRTQSQKCWNDVQCSVSQPYVCERM